jgi:NAD(P)-dependent dehydrogenase (short-subunit alcohol dehydrogenase family)
MLLENRTAIVTGGAGGIGGAIALKFAEEGCSVAIADINAGKAEAIAKLVADKGGKALAIPCDVTDSQQVNATVAKVLGEFGGIDILVNNAGGMTAAPPLEELDEATWDKAMALNLKSNYLFCKAVTPHMKEKRYGKIINLSSMGAVNPPKHSIHYNSAKAGVLGFTYDLAYTLAPFNINVNAIIPGLIETEFYTQLAGLKTDEQKSAFFTMMSKMIPMGRVGTPQDVAGAALFLASELGGYVTGTSIMVSGGLPLAPQNL